MKSRFILLSVALLIIAGHAHASQCRFVSELLWQAPQVVEFSETSTGGEFRFFHTAIDEPIAFSLDRTIVTSAATGEKQSAFTATETVKFRNYLNRIEVFVWDEKNKNGNRVMSITTEVLIRGFTPHTTIVGGFLECK